jgi:ubiquinone/menaquinone biosynthesis C-methylase UbiE
MVFSLIPEQRFARGLEIGAGDGGQSVTISKFCDQLVCTEIDEQSNAWLGQSIMERNLTNVEYRICDAQDLSDFEDDSFDLVYSSNALEHIPDKDRCLSECKRVLKPGGVMLHAMPTRWWKFFSTLLTWVQFKRPGIHGTAKTHTAEFLSTGAIGGSKPSPATTSTSTKSWACPSMSGTGTSSFQSSKRAIDSGGPLVISTW